MSGHFRAKILLFLTHYNDVIWAPWHLESLMTQLFAHKVVQTDSKENIKDPITGPLYGESIVDQ